MYTVLSSFEWYLLLCCIWSVSYYVAIIYRHRLTLAFVCESFSDLTRQIFGIKVSHAKMCSLSTMISVVKVTYAQVDSVVDIFCYLTSVWDGHYTLVLHWVKATR